MEGLMLGQSMTSDVIREALVARGESQQRLFRLACSIRDSHFPSLQVEMRSVIEVSNHCSQRCRFCPMGSVPSNKRFIISQQDLLKSAQRAYDRGRRVLMLQSGESHSQDFIDHLSRGVEEIKACCPGMEIILCLGSLKRQQLEQLKAAGADRYILKFETMNPTLYRRIKPGDRLEHRLSCLTELREQGFAIGSGNIVGLPGQTIDDLVADLLYASRSQWPMVSVSAFVPGHEYASEPAGCLELTLNYLALLRILVPKARIPTTSSLERMQTGGQLRGLLAGANTVTIHDGTPGKHRENYHIYAEERFTPGEKHLVDIVRRAGLKLPGVEGNGNVWHRSSKSFDGERRQEAVMSLVNGCP